MAGRKRDSSGASKERQIPKNGAENAEKDESGSESAHEEILLPRGAGDARADHV